MAFADKLTRVFGDNAFYWEDAVRVAAEDAAEPRRVESVELPNLDEEHPELLDGGMEHAQHMAARERAFLTLLGDTDPPNQILSPSDTQLMVNWPGGGLHRWRTDEGTLFATHGMAQPDDPTAKVSSPLECWSGLGVEYLIRLTGLSEWPVRVLLHLVRYELFQNKKVPFSVGATMPTDLGDGITHFMGTYDSRLPHELLLPAGRCTLVSLVGITAGELEQLQSVDDRRLGAGALIRTLRHFGVDAACTPGRPSVTDDASFDEVWRSALVAAES
jgi:hypothetical protein